MSVLQIVILSFSVLGGIDFLLGNKFGLGKEFEKGFVLLKAMIFSMVGIIVISPLLASWLAPVFDWVFQSFAIDPSIIPSSLFANDMGGASLAEQVAKSEVMGKFNGYVVASMMGCTISFSIPYSFGIVKKEHHSPFIFGILCGIITIPFGCFVAGLLCDIHIINLIVDLLPLLILSIVLSLGLVFIPNICVKIFKVLGIVIKLLAFVGLFMGILNFFAGEPIINGLDTIENGALICFNASISLSGMFPLLFVVSKLLNKPLNKLGNKINMSSKSLVSLIGTLGTNATTYELMNDMDYKGIMINSSFTVSAAFVFGSHLAYTMAKCPEFILPTIVGKLVAGVLAIVLGFCFYSIIKKKVGKIDNHSFR